METEDQQVEQIKRFIKEYGIWIGAGVILGLGGLFTWRAMDAATLERQAEQTASYQAVADRYQQGDDEGAAALAEALIDELDGSAHANVARLQLAQQAVEQGDLAEAGTMLAAVANDAKQQEIAAVARLRLARVQSAQGNHEQALATLEQGLPSSFAGQAAELKGDIYSALGNSAEARNAYESALAAAEENSSASLQMKLDNVAGE